MVHPARIEATDLERRKITVASKHPYRSAMSGRGSGAGVKKCPAALAGAHRAEVTQLAGKNDYLEPTATTRELQVRCVLTRCSVSVPVAVAIAELAFSSGRQP
jgi:hypothetical protein